MPALLDQPGVGPVSAAQLLVTWSHPGRFRSEAAFAALTGTVARSPHPQAAPPATASTPTATATPTAPCTPSPISRLRYHQPTIAYAARRTTEGKTTREIRRCIKRYLARNLYRLMEHQAALDKP